MTGGNLVRLSGSGHPTRYSFLLWTLSALVLSLVACRSSQPGAPPLVSPSVLPAASPSVDPSATSLPQTEGVVATSVPAVSSAQVILMALPDTDAARLSAVEETLVALAAQDGLTFETMTELPELQFSPDTRVVVVLPPDPGVANLAAANPQVQFLALGIPGLQVTSNLSSIGSAGARPDQQGFLAGYLAAVITQDWRVGVVSQGGLPADNAARNGFRNGVIFFCGLCRPSYPPFIQYPLIVDLAAGADLQTAVDALVGNAVKTVYVAPSVEDAALLDLLAQAGLQIIGSSAPSPQTEGQWVASIRLDEVSALRQAWPRLLAGEGGLDFSVPLALVDRNAALFSTGRQRLVDNLLADLLAGYVDSGVDPQTGEMR